MRSAQLLVERLREPVQASVRNIWEPRCLAGGGVPPVPKNRQEATTKITERRTNGRPRRVTSTFRNKRGESSFARARARVYANALPGRSVSAGNKIAQFSLVFLT